MAETNLIIFPISRREIAWLIPWMGDGREAEIIDHVKEHHPELVALEQERLIDLSLSGLVRAVGKNESRYAKSPQFVLPIAIAGLRLPANITVPHGEEDPEYPDESAQWVPLENATIGQLREHIDLLVRGLQANRRRLDSLEQLYLYLKDHTSVSEANKMIGEILHDIVDQENGVA